MGRLKFEFVCETHPEFGDKGWALVGRPEFDPLGGMAVAHDCLEHFPGGAERVGEVADELMALGASIWVRNGGLYYARAGRYDTNPGRHIAADIPSILRHVMEEGMGLGEPPVRAHKPLGGGSEDEEAEEQLGLVRREYLKEGMLDSDESQREFGDRWGQIAGWMREGYRVAKRRYRGVERYDLMMRFCTIKGKADQELKLAEVGDRLFVEPRVRSGEGPRVVYRSGYEFL